MVAWFTRVLSMGDAGGDVELVQRKLHAPTSGTYDRATEARVRGFQRSHDLLVTGVVDASTAEALGESVRQGFVPEWYSRPLQLGDHGEDVYALCVQLGMTDRGTIFDQLVETLVRRFQSAHGLAPTGMVGEHTAVAIGDDVPWYCGDMLNQEAHSL